LSESLEEYLKAIYSINERGRPAKTTELARKLRVAPPSVTQMLKRLADEGLVEYSPYKGVVLTGRGTAIAQRIVRKHRLLERLLHDFLGLNKEKVHQEACRLEHGLSDEAAAALCRALERPESCPDDDKLIPPCTLEVENCEECPEASCEELRLLTQLSNLKPGEEGVVAFVRGERRARQRLLDMGLTKGARVKVVNAAPFKGPLEIEVRGSTLALGRELASDVYIALKPRGPYRWRRRRGWE
jgi:DtxR family Mn-dependent transcriptional regulator